MLFAHSLSGIIATLYASRYSKADMLVLSNPTLNPPIATKTLRLISAKIINQIRVKKPLKLKKKTLDPFNCQEFTLRLLKTVYIDGAKAAKQELKNISLPLLMLSGKLDKLTNYKKLKLVFNKFNSLDKEMRIYASGGHDIVNTAAKTEAVKDILSWLNAKK